MNMDSWLGLGSGKEAVSREAPFNMDWRATQGIDRETGGLATQRVGLRPRYPDEGRRVARSAEAICRLLSAAETRALCRRAGRG